MDANGEREEPRGGKSYGIHCHARRRRVNSGAKPGAAKASFGLVGAPTALRCTANWKWLHASAVLPQDLHFRQFIHGIAIMCLLPPSYILAPHYSVIGRSRDQIPANSEIFICHNHQTDAIVDRYLTRISGKISGNIYVVAGNSIGYDAQKTPDVHQTFEKVGKSPVAVSHANCA